MMSRALTFCSVTHYYRGYSPNVQDCRRRRRGAEGRRCLRGRAVAGGMLPHLLFWRHLPRSRSAIPKNKTTGQRTRAGLVHSDLKKSHEHLLATNFKRVTTSPVSIPSRTPPAAAMCRLPVWNLIFERGRRPRFGPTAQRQRRAPPPTPIFFSPEASLAAEAEPGGVLRLLPEGGIDGLIRPWDHL